MRVLAVTTWGTACGIAEYAAHLAENLPNVGDEAIELIPLPQALDPASLMGGFPGNPPDLIWLNYHAGLHSRWTEREVQSLQEMGYPVVITYHDTYDGLLSLNSDRARALCRVADAFIVHEPVADLAPVVVLRQGIPAPENPQMFGTAYRDAEGDLGLCFKRYVHQPVLGTVGFPFPWKNYDRLAEVTGQLGWALVLIAPQATPTLVDGWRSRNPWIYVETAFKPSRQVISLLSGCDATAFCYECYNTGTSGAIRQGIAARKPVYAFKGCRQFRDLIKAEEVEETGPLIRWVTDFNDLFRVLKFADITRVDPGMVYLAERDSWRRQALAYVDVFRRACFRVSGGVSRA